MKIITATACLSVLSFFGFSQSIPNQLITNWKSISYKHNIVADSFIDVSKLGADLSGNEPADKYVQLALDKTKQNGAVIYFPEGTYLLNNPIELSSNQFLVGDGSGLTTLRFNLNEQKNLISAVGETASDWVKIDNEAQKNDKKLLAKMDYLNPGDLIHIVVDGNDKITSGWAAGTIGQLVEVQSCDGKNIVLKDDLRLDLTAMDNPRLAKVNPKENLGVMNMRIVRNDATTAQTDNILFKYTRNALVSGVHSDSCNFSHVNNMCAFVSKIEGSLFTNAFAYGSGGQGYGIVLGFTSGNCVVENNIFDRLRHAVLFQAGSNGNVVSYNYSKSTFWTGVFSPSDFSGDIVMHGNYPFFNLVEGNIIQNLIIDDSHGKNGPGNVFLRNRIENAGIFMNNNPASDNQVFIGNEVTGNGTSSNGYANFPKGLYVLNGNGHYQYGNNANGTFIPEAVSAMINTLYITAKPAFLSNSNLPLIGFPNTFNQTSIPASERFTQKVKTVDYQFGNSLRVKFEKLNAVKKSSSILVVWKTDDISHCQNYAVYRKSDGNDEKQVASLNCGSKINTDEYSFEDFNYPSSSKIITYYIEQMDDNGRKTTSEELTVSLSGNLASISTDGNGLVVCSEIFNHINVYSFSGKLIYESDQISGYNHQLSGQVAKGIYVVELEGNGNVYRGKICKN
ncbi:MAG: hypothetical protein H6607_10210 [Flavobacteriales bacterium]|nr:hypothetical protein [Flavobacteriales bacterium]